MTAAFALQRKKLGSVKTLQNFCKICLFSLQKFVFWMQNLRFFLPKTAGTDRRLTWQVSERALYLHCPLCKSLGTDSIRSKQFLHYSASPILLQSSQIGDQLPEKEYWLLRKKKISSSAATSILVVSSFPAPIAAFTICFSFRFSFTGISRKPGEDIKTEEKACSDSAQALPLHASKKRSWPPSSLSRCARPVLHSA